MLKHHVLLYLKMGEQFGMPKQLIQVHTKLNCHISRGLDFVPQIKPFYHQKTVFQCVQLTYEKKFHPVEFAVFLST